MEVALRLEAITSRLEAIALEAIALGLEAIAGRLEAIATRRCSEWRWKKRRRIDVRSATWRCLESLEGFPSSGNRGGGRGGSNFVELQSG